MDPVIVEHLGKDHPLARHLDDFLTDRKNAGASPHTLRAYRGDLLQFTAHCDGEIAELTAPPATELINAGVSIEVVRRRLGHSSTETTQLYTLLADVADTEIRAARRRRDRR